jgi:hypothetical protein
MNPQGLMLARQYYTHRYVTYLSLFSHNRMYLFDPQKYCSEN